MYSVNETELWIYIPFEDADLQSGITTTLVETASVLPNTQQMMDDDGNRQIMITQGDAQRWPAVVEELRKIVNEYERNLEDDESSGVKTNE